MGTVSKLRHAGSLNGETWAERLDRLLPPKAQEADGEAAKRDARIREDLALTYEELGGKAYLRRLAIEQPHLFLRMLTKYGVIGDA